MYFFPKRPEPYKYVEEQGVISKYAVLDLIFKYEQQFSLMVKYLGNTEVDTICK